MWNPIIGVLLLLLGSICEMHRFYCVWLRRACFCFFAESHCTKIHNAFLPSTIKGHWVVSRMGLSSTEPRQMVSCPSLEHTCTRFPCAFTETCACSFSRCCLTGFQVSPMLIFKASFYSVGPKTKHMYYIELRLPMGSTPMEATKQRGFTHFLPSPVTTVAAQRDK